MNEQITDRGPQKRLHTKFHTMNIMRSGTLLIKYSISSNIRQARCGHALSIHESRQGQLPLLPPASGAPGQNNGILKIELILETKARNLSPILGENFFFSDHLILETKFYERIKMV